MRVFRVIVIIIFVACLGLYAGTGVREKIRNDGSAPEIHTDREVLELSVSDPPEKLLEGLTAGDEEDGDLTDSIMVSGTSYFVEKGEATVTYVVFDSDNKSGTLRRDIHYTDYCSPEFFLTQPLVFPVNSSEDFLDYVQASDVLDGDITDKVRMSGTTIDTTTAGVYPITLEVTNSCGDRALVNTNVVIRDTNISGSIALTNYLVYTDRGSQFDPGTYVDYVTISDGSRLETEGLEIYENGYFLTDIHVSGEVNTENPGSYQLEYTYSTSRSQGSAWLTVVVRE